MIIAFFTLDLPKLHTIAYHGRFALAGDNRDDCNVIVDGYESKDNTLIMKSKLNKNVDCVVMIV